MSIVLGLSAPGELTVEAGREKSLGPEANCIDFEIRSVDAVKSEQVLLPTEGEKASVIGLHLSFNHVFPGRLRSNANE